MAESNPIKHVDNEPIEAAPAEIMPINAGPLPPAQADQFLNDASHIATRLADIIKKKTLSVRIGNKDYVVSEGWTTLAALMGGAPREVESIRQGDGGYVSRVELVGRDGRILSSAEALCGVDEKTWASRPEYARTSMACTRAVGKACRIAYSWVMVLAGYAPTPAEEMPGQSPHDAERVAAIEKLGFELAQWCIEHVSDEGVLAKFKTAFVKRIKILGADNAAVIGALYKSKENEFQE